MNVVDIMRVLMNETVGNRGAVRNCRTELVRRRDADLQIDALCRRVPAPPSVSEATDGAATA